MRETSYYEPIGTDKEGNEIQLLDIMESGEPEAMEQIQLKDDSLRIYRLLEERLSERERLVLIMRYGLYGGREYTQERLRNVLESPVLISAELKKMHCIGCGNISRIESCVEICYAVGV